MSPRRALAALALGGGLASVAAPAGASPAYSVALGQRAQAAAEPPCGVCHAAAPDADPATMTPFAQALRERGFTDGTTLVAAFDRMAVEYVDSDGDKAIDTDEIGWGGDPNGYDGPVGEPAPELEQGFCGVGRAPGAPPAGAALGCALALAAALAGRRR